MSRGSILIVDADQELSKIVAAFFSAYGFRVSHTSRSRDAIKKLSLQKYSAVILDPDLSQGDHGEEVLFGASDSGGLNNQTPVIIVSRSLKYELPNEAMTHVRAIITKPFRFDDLHTVLTQNSLL